MKHYDYLIIGGGIAGVTAAETIRANDASATIGIVSAEPHPLYSRVMLPAYLKGRINRDKLFLRTADDFVKKKIDLLLNEEAASIDTTGGIVILASGQKIYWTSLLIASGGRVLRWGAAEDQSVIYRLQTIDDADRMHKNMPEIRSPVAVGSSFIALEFLEIFADNGLAPTLLSRMPHYFDQVLDDEGGQMMAEHLKRHSVTLRFSDHIKEMRADENTTEIVTERGDTFTTNAIAVGIGIEPNLSFLSGTDIEYSARGVHTNEYLQTKHPNIYAAGDIAYFFDPITQTQRRVGNWTNAVLQGKIAGQNMMQRDQKGEFRAVPSYTITNFGWNITMVGDCRPEGKQTIMRSAGDRFFYERFFLHDGALAGAILINAFHDKMAVARLIEQKTLLTTHISSLADPAFDIRALAP